MNILQEIFNDYYDEIKYTLRPSKCELENIEKMINYGAPSNVTFHYNRHEDDCPVEETIPAMDFIKRLIRHIPEKYFKMIQYGGLYGPPP